jgi:glycosyltransferase involved in cell wall biosynthesis
MKIWFPAIRAGSGTDVFTKRLAAALEKRGIPATITWLPHHAEYAPWLVAKPKPPTGVTVMHCNSWLHERMMPAGIPMVVTIHHSVHDTALQPYKNPLQRLYHQHWIRRLEATAIDRADRVTAVSRYTATQAIEVFGCNDISTIYNWVDPQVFHPPKRQQPGDPFRLLFVGNLSRRKGADLLPAIMRHLGDRFVLHYTGSQHDFGRDVRLPSNMVALGHLEGTEALVEAYQHHDALLFPTRLEGFGLSAIEAQACGLPVISTHCSSIPEVVEDGKTALLCPLDDVAAFADAARRLQKEPTLWLRMSEAASQRAKLFSENIALTRYINIYRKLTA